MYKTGDNGKEIGFSVNKGAIDLLFTNGYTTMEENDKNDLVILLADSEGVLLNEVTTQFILDYHKKAKLAELNTACDDAICAGFTASNGNTYRTNRDDQINMIGQKDVVNASPTISTVPWKTENAGYLNHTREDWLKVYNEAFLHKQTQLFKYNTLKKAVNDATVHSEVIAVKWA